MSTKIYNAYKLVPKGDPWEAIWRLQARAQQEVKSQLILAYRDALCRVDLQSDEYKKELEELKEDWRARLRLVHNQFKERYKKARDTAYLDEYDFDVVFAISPYKGAIYVRAFFDHTSVISKALDFLKDCPELVDFHYQNQVDKPAEVSAKEWKHRRDTWEGLCDSKTGVVRHVALEVCNKDLYWRIDPHHELIAQFKKNPPTFPTPEEVVAQDLTKHGFKASAKNGHIIATKEGVSYEILLVEDQWRVLVDGELTDVTFSNMTGAYGHVDFLGLPEDIRRRVEGMVERMRARASDQAEGQC